jgi:cysteine desulfurase
LAVYSALEHACVRRPFEKLRQRGWRVERLNVSQEGVIDSDQLQALLAQKPALVSLMAVNNEMGAVQDLNHWGPLVRAAGAVFHVDAVQALGLYSPEPWSASMMTISAHKLGGPQGVGALVLRRGTPWKPVLLGGPHEQGRRPGTLAVPPIAAFGAAAADAVVSREAEYRRLERLSTRIAGDILDVVPGARVLGTAAARSPHILAFSVPGATASTLLEQMDLAGVALSSGAACNSMKQEPSPVLEALGLSAAVIEGSLRLSLGWSTTEHDVNDALARMLPILRQAAVLRPRA